MPSVSPIEEDVGAVGESEDEECDDAMYKECSKGIEGEHIELDKEDECVRRLVDPLLPSADEVETHRIMGHIPYRNWCILVPHLCAGDG